MWEKTKNDFDKLEKKLIECRINFLRKIAKIFIQKGRGVFFKENKVAHWGEGNFGNLLIEGEEKPDELFGEFVSEVSFISDLNEKSLKGYIKIKEAWLNLIKYDP